MSHFDLIRRQARAFRSEIGGAEADALLPAETLLELAEKFTFIQRFGLPKNDPMLCGASALLDEDRIYFDKTLPASFALYCQAHEYAHFRLHETSAHCAGGEINFSVAETEAFNAETRVLGYGQSERVEREANAFAAEFLLPCGLASKFFRQEKMKASEIARRTGLPVNLVYSQLTQSLIEIQSSEFKVRNQSESETANPESKNENPKSADQTQISAWRTSRCPTLLEAAPGTGKTHTLIERICFLLREESVAPESILALTFSNKAAEEMRERVREATDEETARKIVVSTFHAFALELLRKYHTAANLSPTAPVIDRMTAVELLEEKLLSLKLEHFQNLREPLENLPKILGAVSRAKDELVSADEFQKLAEEQSAKAETVVEREKAEKCLETARVYQIYERLMRERNLLDYGDLIFRAVTLLRENESVREWINEEFQHVLVDEYQDVNRASAEFLRLISNNGKGVWAVGDARQAIYRWRGAATTRNVRDFSKDFPAAQSLYLGKNYRSRPKIVAAVSEFAKEINCDSVNEQAANFTDWQAHRGEESGEIRFAVAENLAEGAAWMATQMRELQEKGIAWREQAVIARTHLTLQRVAEELEKHDVPFQYVGNWLESPVVRDLLSWLALIGEVDNYAIARVADFAAYRISFPDVQRINSFAAENQVSLIEAVKSLTKTSEFSETATDAFARLLKDCDSVRTENSTWAILANFLFENGSYLNFSENELTASARLALYQLLQLAQSFDAKNSAKSLSRNQTIGEFLRYVRRLKMFGEEQALQQIPASMQETDAVRLLTIHACKGLEFEAVFIPHLGGQYYPKSRRGNNCPLPDGITDSDEKAEHEQEEKCLFFVAISRARQVLCLSRAEIYGKQSSNASPFLKILAAHLPFSPESGATWHSQNFQSETNEKIELPAAADSFQNIEFYLSELENYETCPQRYFYHTNLRREKFSGAMYLEFHRSLHAALNIGFGESKANRKVSLQQLIEAFGNRWAKSGHTAHAYSELYTAEAEKILQNVLTRISVNHTAKNFNFNNENWHFDLPNGRIFFKPDFAGEIINERGETKILIERWRSGKLRKKEADETLYQLLHETVRRKSDKTETAVKVTSLANGEEIFAPRKLRRGKEIPVEEKFSKLIDAIDGISRRNFLPKPHDNCSSCQFYFICPSNDLIIR